MKVLWFSNSPASGAEYLKSGGLGGGWLSSLDRLLGQRIELHVAFYYPKFETPFVHNGIHYYPICKKNWKLQWVKSVLFDPSFGDQDLSTYLQIIDTVKPDIIHILGTENQFGVMTTHTQVPVAVSIQGNITVYKQKFFSGIERTYSHKRNYTSLFEWLISRSFYQNFCRFEKMSVIERKCLVNSMFVIGRTHWDRRIMSVMAPKATYYHNDEILRPGFYEKNWRKIRTEKLIIHTTNGNSIYKGFETLCEALYELNQHGIPVEWRVAGVKESDQIVGIVKRVLKDRFPQKGLKLMGGLNETQLVDCLLEADMYVMPSHIENSPNNLCEAMILGMPCIATYAGGTGSLMTDGVDGVLIQDGDPWVMAGAIIELYNDQEKAYRYGERARYRALKRHYPKSIVDGLIQIYQDVINSNSNAK